MRVLALLLVIIAALASTRAGDAGAMSKPSLTICSAGGRECRPGSLADIPDMGRIFEVRQRVDPSTFRSPLPVAVTVIAMADSELVWNDRPLARNGDPDGEGRSGLFVFTVLVPRDQVRTGVNEVIVRMKRPRDAWPIAQPVHLVSIAPYVDPRLDTLSRYLPALRIGSALATAALWFGLAFAMDRAERGARLLALAAAGTVVQLALETARAFVDYPHIWQPPRLALIAILGAFVGLMLVRYAAWRFAPAVRNPATLTCAVALGLVLLLADGFDLKALQAFQVCMVVILGLAGWALYRGVRTAGFALAGVIGVLVWIARDGTQFLDRGYYLALGGVVLALAIEQIGSGQRRADPAMGDPTAPEPPEPVVWRIVTGAKVRLVPVETVAFLTAADDYTEVGLTDGRTCLHTESLSQAVIAGSGVFMRVHRSHAVNRRLVRGSEARAGGGMRLTLEGGSTVPVGRTFQRSVRHELGLG